MVPVTTTEDGTIIISIPKRFDIDSIPFIEKELGLVYEKNPARVLFDFSGTDYLSSAGMRLLLSSLRTITGSGGTVALSSLCRQVKYVFEISGFDKIFTIYETREKALKKLKKQA
jgi:anti-anti-sigma factor